MRSWFTAVRGGRGHRHSKHKSEWLSFQTGAYRLCDEKGTIVLHFYTFGCFQNAALLRYSPQRKNSQTHNYLFKKCILFYFLKQLSPLCKILCWWWNQLHKAFRETLLACLISWPWNVLVIWSSCEIISTILGLSRSSLNGGPSDPGVHPGAWMSLPLATTSAQWVLGRISDFCSFACGAEAGSGAGALTWRLLQSLIPIIHVWLSCKSKKQAYSLL